MFLLDNPYQWSDNHHLCYIIIPGSFGIHPKTNCFQAIRKNHWKVFFAYVMRLEKLLTHHSLGNMIIVSSILSCCFCGNIKHSVLPMLLTKFINTPTEYGIDALINFSTQSKELELIPNHWSMYFYYFKAYMFRMLSQINMIRINNYVARDMNIKGLNSILLFFRKAIEPWIDKVN